MLQSGTRLGPYEVVSPLGKGGMGEVYRARDTSLDREVAVKVLPAEFASDPERLARFEREAKVLASLNHPNIGHIHGLERSGETPALVLELVEGPTLHELIRRRSPSGSRLPPSGLGTGAGRREPANRRQGPSLDEALPIARQIAEALEAAHEQGIIHRDLKPANIKVTPDGVVKVLDFGLAKVFEDVRSAPSSGGAIEDPAESPTLTMSAAATRAGLILGTAAYMSPEQAKGRPVDRRTDAWAFGVVLYEMLTGRQAFAASDISETLAFVLTRDVDLSRLPDDTPASIRRLLRRCLVRDRKNRLADLSMARIEIDEALNPSVLPAPTDRSARSDPSTRSDRSGLRWPVAASLALAMAATAVVMWLMLHAPDEPGDVLRLSVDPAGRLVIPSSASDVAISPDGRTIVYTAEMTDAGGTTLYLRSLDQLDATVVRGTQIGDGPFVSPDGQWVGFATASELRKVPVRGGPSVSITPLSGRFRGASWGEDDHLVFGSPTGGLCRVPVAGGEQVELTRPAPGLSDRWPLVLPGARAVLFSRQNAGRQFDSPNELMVLALDSGEITPLGLAGTYPRYSPTGHLVYAVVDRSSDSGSIFAVPFDLDRVQVTGVPVPMIENVVVKTAGSANFDLSRDGRLVYMQGGAGSESRNLVWVDRTGRAEPLPASPGAYFSPQISPDGTRVAVDRTDGDTPDVWVLDLERRTETKLTTDAFVELSPLWSPDGTRIVFGSVGESEGGLFWKAVDGSGDVERLTRADAGSAALAPTAWSADGGRIAYWVINDSADIGLASTDGSADTVLLGSEFQEQAPAISPDGRWIAYESNGSGQSEVYVERFPELGQRTIVSRGGGRQPLWSRDGTELFYRAPAGMTVVPVETGASFSAGEPEVLFEDDYYFFLARRTYDVTPDGQRFLMVTRGDPTAPEIPLRIIVVENWGRELMERVPAP